MVGSEDDLDYSDQVWICLPFFDVLIRGSGYIVPM